MENRSRMALMVPVAMLLAACKPEGHEQQEQSLEQRYEAARQQCETLRDDERRLCEQQAEQSYKEELDSLRQQRGGGLGGGGDPAGGAM